MPKKPSVQQLIEHLGCIREVDMMLREGVSSADVARFIQDDQQQLPNVPHKTLANALAVRKRAFEDEMGDQEGFADVVYQNEDAMDTAGFEPMKMGIVAKLAQVGYKRLKGGIRENIELEALYLTQRSRVDKLLEMEAEDGVLMKTTSDEIVKASTVLSRLTATKKAMGIIGVGIDDSHIVGDYEGLSREASDVLQKPESRRKVLDLVDRLQKRGQLKFEIEAPSVDDAFDSGLEIATD